MGTLLAEAAGAPPGMTPGSEYSPKRRSRVGLSKTHRRARSGGDHRAPGHGRHVHSAHHGHRGQYAHAGSGTATAAEPTATTAAAAAAARSSANRPFWRLPLPHAWFPDVHWAWSSMRRVSVPDSVERDEIRQAVLESAAVRREEQLERAFAVEHGQTFRRRAPEMLTSMMACSWLMCMRVMIYILRKIWRVIYPLGIHVEPHEVAKLQALAGLGVPIVLLPSHKSHIDYIMVSYVLSGVYNLPLPHVVAGDNLNIPIVGRLLRWCGAFYIRRSFGNDPLYRAVFNEYVTQLLCRGHTVECFLEGTRSRTGKVMPPKPGFLRCVVDAVVDNRLDDVYLVPISLGYDRIVENDSHVSELAGKEKQSEAFWRVCGSIVSLFMSIFTAKVSFGRVDVGIAEPISMRKYLDMLVHVHRSPMLEDLAGGPMERMNAAQRRHVTLSLAYYVMWNINQVTSVLPTALVGTILFAQIERGISHKELVQRVLRLQQDILARGGRIIEHKGVSLADNVQFVIDHVLGGRQSLIKRFKAMLCLKLYSPLERLELATARNQLIHNFVSDSLIAASFYACEKVTGPAYVELNAVREATSFLSRLLKRDFIFRPFQRTNQNFERTLDRLVRFGILHAHPTDPDYYIAGDPPRPDKLPPAAVGAKVVIDDLGSEVEHAPADELNFECIRSDDGRMLRRNAHAAARRLARKGTDSESERPLRRRSSRARTGDGPSSEDEFVDAVAVAASHDESEELSDDHMIALVSAAVDSDDDHDSECASDAAAGLAGEIADAADKTGAADDGCASAERDADTTVPYAASGSAPSTPTLPVASRGSEAGERETAAPTGLAAVGASLANAAAGLRAAPPRLASLGKSTFWASSPSLIEHPAPVGSESNSPLTNRAAVMMAANDDAFAGSRGSEAYLFLASLLWSIIDSYWLCSLTFLTLLPDRIMTVNRFVQHAQELGERLYFTGQLDLYEAIAKTSIFTAVGLFEEWGIVAVSRAEGAKDSLIRLRPKYLSVDALRTLIVRVGRFKKRSRQYRSRRYQNNGRTDITDAIEITLEMGRKLS